MEHCKILTRSLASSIYKAVFVLALAVSTSGCYFLPDFVLVANKTTDQTLDINPLVDQPEITHPRVNPVIAEYSEYETTSTALPEVRMDRFLVAQVHSSPINALVTSRDGTMAISGGQDGLVAVNRIIRSQSLDTSTGKTKRRKPIKQTFIQTQGLLQSTKPITALALSADEKQILVAMFSSVVVFDLESKKITARLTRIKGRVLSLAWDPRGELAAIGRANGDVFIWDPRESFWASSDSLDSVERYEAGSSPIISLVFHPSGRSFFAAEREGGVVFWRLLRTEKELGLLDENAQVDKTRRGRRAVRLGPVVGTVEDIWLSHNADQLFASVNDGNVYRWKIRGLKPLKPLVVGNDAVFSVRGLLVPTPGRSYQTIPLLVTSGRGQRLKFWCKNPPPEPPPSAVTVIPSDTDLATAAVPDNVEIKPRTIGFIGQSQLFSTPLTIVRGGERSPLLWAAEKTGNLLSFDADLLLHDRAWLNEAKRCLADTPVTGSPVTGL